MKPPIFLQTVIKTGTAAGFGHFHTNKMWFVVIEVLVLVRPLPES